MTTPEQQAQVERWRADFKENWLKLHSIPSPKGFDRYQMIRTPDGRYFGDYLQNRWEGWLARAERDEATIAQLQAQVKELESAFLKGSEIIGRANTKIAELEARLAAGEPCVTCNGSGIVGHPPDDYWDCPECTKPAQPPAAQVPDGYALVPLDPTREMIVRGRTTTDHWGELQAEACYRAMLAAAAPTHKESKT